MSSADRSKKRIHLLKKSLAHFALCFVMGFFTGFAPPGTATLFSGHPVKAEAVQRLLEPAEAVNRTLVEIPTSAPGAGAGSVVDIDPPPPMDLARPRELLPPSRRMLIIVTTTRSGDRNQAALLRRLAHSLRLVPPPLLWVVVQAHADSAAAAAVLRSTGLMYRHLTFKENFTDPAAETDHQRSVALSHVEYHRLTGIVHFAGASNVYDLQFFDEIRDIEAFGTWPVAMMSTNGKKVVVDGPICRSSKVEGWILKNSGGEKTFPISGTELKPKPTKINISGFAFNSSILWDSERWGRSTSLPDTSQDSINFVRQLILEDATKLKGIPADCSKILVWNHCKPSLIRLPSHQPGQ